MKTQLLFLPFGAALLIGCGDLTVVMNTDDTKLAQTEGETDFGKDARVDPGEVSNGSGIIAVSPGYAMYAAIENGKVIVHKLLLPSSSPEWESCGSGAVSAEMQWDGNFVASGAYGPTFATGTDGNDGAYLEMQDDGNLVLYKDLSGGGRKALWESGSNGRRSYKCEGFRH